MTVNAIIPCCRKVRGQAHKTSADAHRQALTGVLIKSLPGLLRTHQTDEAKVGSSRLPCGRSLPATPCTSAFACAPSSVVRTSAASNRLITDPV